MPDSPDKQWGVLSEDGQIYRVGTWKGGEWIPGTREDAERERDLLRESEPGAEAVEMASGKPSLYGPNLGSTPVTDLPNFHHHPECLNLWHGHGDPYERPERHTHERKTSWGDAVPVGADWDQAAETYLALLHDALVRQVGPNSTILDPVGSLRTDDTALLIRALDNADRFFDSFAKVFEASAEVRHIQVALVNARTLLRERIQMRGQLAAWPIMDTPPAGTGG